MDLYIKGIYKLNTVVIISNNILFCSSRYNIRESSEGTKSEEKKSQVL